MSIHLPSPLPLPIDVDGYRLLRLIGRGSHSVVFYAESRSGPVAIKMLATSARVSEVMAQRLRREAIALIRLRHAALPQVYATGDFAGRPYIALEYLPGGSLAQKMGSAMAPERVVEVAESVARTLAGLHQRGFIHRDIKPANILFDRSERARLVDLDLFTELELPTATNQAEFAGTPSYAAPEQTGMLKRPVDTRSDLYSLGVVMYECLTGAMPFAASDPAEVMRMQLASRPLPVVALAPDTPPALAGIVERLMAKDPDDRFQRALDLLQALSMLARPHDGDSGRGGRGGRPGLLGRALPPVRTRPAAPPRPPIARQEQLQALIAALAGVIHGAGQAIVISGETGSGKSQLARELASRARDKANQLTLMHGACTSSSPAPFLPLRRALATSAADALAPGDDLLDLQALLALPHAPATLASKERLIAAMSRAIIDRVNIHGPALLLIEDAQWADDGTVQVLADLATHVPNLPLLLVATARIADNDGRGAHLSAMLVERNATTMVLGALEPAQSKRLIGEMLGDVAVDEPLCARIHEIAHGNPLAVQHCVNTALDSGLLGFASSSWSLRGTLDDLVLPQDVMHMLGHRLDALEPATVELLQAAAVLGVSFDREALAALVPEYQRIPAPGVPGSDILSRHLNAAFLAGVVRRRGEHRYVFVHEELAARLLERMPAADRAGMHQLAAEMLDRHQAGRAGQAGGAFIYDLARQYAAGQVDKNPRRVYETNLAAGLQAAAEHADELAQQFLTCARRAADRAGIEPDPLLLARWGDALFRQRRFGEALIRFDEALARTSEPVACARLYIAKALVCMQWAEWPSALRLLGQSFALLGVEMPGSGTMGAVWSGVRWLARRSRAMATGRSSVSATPSATRPATGGPASDLDQDRALTLIELYNHRAYLGYFEFDWPLMTRCMLEQWPYVEQVGDAPEAARSHAYMAVLWTQLGRASMAERAIAQSMDMAERLGDPATIALVTSMSAHVAEALGRFGQAVELYELVRREQGRWLPLTEYSNSTPIYGLHLLGRGHMRRAFEVISELHHRMAGEDLIDLHLDGLYTLLSAILGERDSVPALWLDFERRYRTLSKSSSYHVYHYAVIRCFMHLMIGDENALDRAVAALAGIHATAPRLPTYEQLSLVIEGYARIFLARRAAGATRRRRIGELVTWRSGPCRALDTGLHASHKLVILGWIEVLTGNTDSALEHALRAKAGADQHDSPWPLFEAELLHVDILGRLDAPHAAILRRMSHAYEIARENGMHQHAELLRSSEPTLNLGTTRTGGSSLSAARTRDVSEVRLQRHLDALMQVSLASASAVDPEEQARRAVGEVLAILGAERAFLFLVGKDGALGVVAGRDAQGRELAQLSGFSSTVVERVAATRRPMVIGGSDDGELIGSISIITHDLRSMIAAPLLMKNRLTGVLYLDNRLASGVFTGDDVGILQAICNHIAIALETARLAQLARERALLERDLAVTSAVQALLVPHTTSATWPELCVAAYFQPATRSGGDWYWYERLPDGRFLTLLGDATGHGAGSAMLTAVVASAYHTLMRSTPDIRPPALLARIHDTLVQICDGQYAVTMSVLELDPVTRRMSWWNAGGTPLMILGRTGEVELVIEAGTPLGTQSPGEHDEPDQPGELVLGTSTRTYQPGERLLMFSDGIKELPMACGRPVGYRRLKRQLIATRPWDTDAAIRHLAALRELAAPDGETDDITLLVVDVDRGPEIRPDHESDGEPDGESDGAPGNRPMLDRG